MAGIGFQLKKMFREESYSKRTKAYLYSALVAAGPWISAVITVNLLIFTMDFVIGDPLEKKLFMGTIVYSFLFSQIITAPWQLIITRYISDRLYGKEYSAIRPSFVGLNKIIFLQVFIIAVIFYFNSKLPLYYKIMAVYLFLLISMIWILMVYLSAVKNYELIAKGYIYGGMLSFALTIMLIFNPIKFSHYIYASNLLFSYIIGTSLTFVILLYNFLSTFYVNNNLEYDFLRYLSRFPSLFFIGLFYTLGLWIDDLLMWFSIAGEDILETYLYAPTYDNAVFLAYLTTIPTMVLFLVSVETEFYDTYKKYYNLVNGIGTYEEIELAKQEMKETVYRKLMYTFQVQTLLTVTTVLFSRGIFSFFKISVLIRNIFRVCAFGALFNIFILLVVLILLYYESRKRALICSFIFFILNTVLTKYYIGKGLNYYGYGFTIACFIAFVISLFMMVVFLKDINFTTFALQPVIAKEEKGFFELLANGLNEYKKKQMKKRLKLKNKNM